MSRPRAGDGARLRFTREMHVLAGGHFARAYRRGSRAKGAWMTVAVVENELGVTRLGLSIGKSCWRSAVRRNRVRRVFREAFRLSQPGLPVGLDVILIGSRPRIEPELAPVQAELVELVARARRRLLERRAAESAAESGTEAGP